MIFYFSIINRARNSKRQTNVICNKNISKSLSSKIGLINSSQSCLLTNQNYYVSDDFLTTRWDGITNNNCLITTSMCSELITRYFSGQNINGNFK